MLADWEAFVRSPAIPRLVRHVKRGMPFPKLTNDEVTQFLVEEACFELVAMQEHKAGSAAIELEGGSEAAELSPQQLHEQTMAALRGAV